MASDWGSSSGNWPACITKAASKQTYYTIRLFVDRDRVADAYSAYAYFRWLDDMLDENLIDAGKRVAFVQRQRTLVERAYAGAWPPDLAPEERILAKLIARHPQPGSGLHIYIQNMLAVMAFDADRHGKLVSQCELDTYTQHLAVAVTEALHYFIGCDQYAPNDTTRYLAVSAAHVTHMLRDAAEDLAAGYYNIPREYLETYGISPWDMSSSAYRRWVRERVQLAQDGFRAGKVYLAQVENWRCRLAGYAYMARFEGVLTAISREGYQLRPAYNERKTVRGGLRIGASVLSLMLRNRPPQGAGGPAVTGTRKRLSVG